MDFHIYSENALLIQLNEDISIDNLSKVLTIKKLAEATFGNELQDAIIAYASIMLVFRNKVVPKLSNPFFNTIKNHTSSAPEGKTHEVPVCYHENLAPDLAQLALKNDLSIEEVIKQHVAIMYHVYMLGFLPGFAYLGTVNKLIATPRLKTPRLKVNAGSVGIAGSQTGIYPVDAPGGWNIIGRTPLSLIGSDDNSGIIFKPGDRVKFLPIEIEEFKNWSNV